VLEGLRPGGLPSPRHRGGGPSLEVRRPFRVFLAASLRAFWVARIHLGLGRFRLTRVVSVATVPRPLRARVHPLLGLPPLQSSNRSSRPVARTRRAPPTGFRPSIATSAQGVH